MSAGAKLGGIDGPGRTLDFRSLAGTDNTSWTRAADGYEIECISQLGYRVQLADSDNWHVVVLGVEDGEHVGVCDCKGYEYNSGPCAHLCAVRQAAWVTHNCGTDETDVTGRPIRIVDLDAVDPDEARYPYLSDLQREAYMACDKGDMGVREYQRAKGYSSPGTVSNRLRKAREKVAKHNDELRADGGRDEWTAGGDRRLLGEGVSR